MSLTSDNLVGYLLAEFGKASRLRVTLFFLQLAAAVPAAVAVLIPDHYSDALYWLAGAGAVLLIAWWFVNGRYRRIENAAQAARRGALLLGGLNEPLSPSEIQALRERFTVSAAEAKKCEMACTRFRRHRVRCFDGAGGGSWRDGSLRESSSLRPCA
jgi:hypothetical protein